MARPIPDDPPVTSTTCPTIPVSTTLPVQRPKDRPIASWLVNNTSRLSKCRCGSGSGLCCRGRLQVRTEVAQQPEELLALRLRHAGCGALGHLGEDRRDDLLELPPAVGEPDDRPPSVRRIGLTPEQAGGLHASQSADERGDLDADAAGEHADRLTVLVPELVQDIVLARMNTMGLETAAELGIDPLERLRERAKEGGGEGLGHTLKVPPAAVIAFRTARAARAAAPPSRVPRPPARRSASPRTACPRRGPGPNP